MSVPIGQQSATPSLVPDAAAPGRPTAAPSSSATAHAEAFAVAIAEAVELRSGPVAGHEVRGIPEDAQAHEPLAPELRVPEAQIPEAQAVNGVAAPPALAATQASFVPADGGTGTALVPPVATEPVQEAGVPHASGSEGEAGEAVEPEGWAGERSTADGRAVAKAGTLPSGTDVGGTVVSGAAAPGGQAAAGAASSPSQAVYRDSAPATPATAATEQVGREFTTLPARATLREPQGDGAASARPRPELHTLPAPATLIPGQRADSGDTGYPRQVVAFPGGQPSATPAVTPVAVPVAASVAVPVTVPVAAPVTAPAGAATPARQEAATTVPSPAAVGQVPSAAPIMTASITTAPVAPAPATNTPTTGFAAQVARPVFSLAAAGVGEHVMTINVTPDNLGPVTVRAHVTGEHIRVELFAPSDPGREALRAILPDLRRDLAGTGLSAQLDLSSQNQASDPGDRRQQSSSARQPMSESTPEAAAATPTAVTSTAVLPHGSRTIDVMA